MLPDVLQRTSEVLEPFAGLGPLGLMALALGARSVELLDVNTPVDSNRQLAWGRIFEDVLARQDGSGA